MGGAIAFYLTLFQWETIRNIWDPFFSGGDDYPNGSSKILKSPTSEILPHPLTDGFLGFLGYVGDAVTGLIGGTRRWRTMPWIVILFGILVGPLGAISIILVMTQPLAYDTFCTLCLATAVISVLMIGPAMDEMLASLQYMRRVKANGRPFWRYFWGLGDQEPLLHPAPPPETAASSPAPAWIGSITQWIIAGLGIYLMAAPALLGYDGTRAADVDRVIGPLIAAVGLISAWEATRNVRWSNILLAGTLILLAVSPWPVPTPRLAMISDIMAAAAVIGLTLIPYPATQRFGGGWRALWPLRPGPVERP